MAKIIYLAVTADKYELPVDFAESGMELAEKIGAKRMNLYRSISTNSNLQTKGEKLKVVKVTV